MLYNSQHESNAGEYIYLKTDSVPDITLDKYAISTATNTSYMTIRLPGHGFKDGYIFRLGNVVGRKETVIKLTNSNNTAVITAGDIISLSADNQNTPDVSFNGPWGYVISKDTGGTEITVAMVTGVFAEGNIIKTSNGGAGTIAGNGEGLYETTDRYFGGIVAHHTTEPIVDIGTFDWTVQATGLTVDEFRLATSTNPVFRRSGVIVDPGSITLTSSPTRNADLIYYSGRMVTNTPTTDNDLRRFKHEVTGNTPTNSDATLNADTYLDQTFKINDSLNFYWYDDRAATESTDNAPFIDRKTVSANIIKNLSSSNYISKKEILKKPANSIKVIVDASIPFKSSLKAYVRIATAISEGTFEDNPWIEIRPDKKILNDDSGKFESYQFSNDDLNEYGIYQVKLVMSTTDTSKIVKIKKLKIIPNKIDNSLKPLQTATIQINKFILDDSILSPTSTSATGTSKRTPVVCQAPVKYFA